MGKVIGKSIGLFIKESFIFIGMRLLLLARSFVETIINQTAGTLEIKRLAHEESLAVSEFVINHQGSFTFIFGFGVVLLGLLAIYVAYKDIVKIVEIVKAKEEK